MKGLFLKDYYLMRPALRTYLGILVFYIALAFFSVLDTSFLSGFLCIFISVLPISAFSYDTQARWTGFAAALPLNRKKIVGARYLFALACTGLAAVISALANLLFLLLGKGEAGELFFTLLTCMGVALLGNVVILPLTYRFGPEKARLLWVALYFAIAFLTVALVKLDLPLPEFLFGLGPAQLFALVLGAMAVLLCLVPISFLLSCKIFERKDL